LRRREYFEIQRYARVYDRREGKFIISLSYKTATDITPRTIKVAEAFGIGTDEQEFIIYDNVELKIGPRDIVHITGDSGSGKSVLLKAFKKDLGPGPGFEPGRQAPQNLKYKGKENLLSDYRDFLKIDMQLHDLTVQGHLMVAKRFLSALNKPIKNTTREDIRGYLALYRDKNPNTYANQLKSLRVLFRDFLNMNGIIKMFRFPARQQAFKMVPSNKQVQKFYDALEKPIEKALFLFYATSGLRKHEVLSLKIEDVDFAKRMIAPNNTQSRTKRRWISFFNAEALQALKEYLATRNDDSPKLFRIGTGGGHHFDKIWRKGFEKTGIRITPQVLREWFCSEMARLKVPDRYVDAFCGRVPKSILAKHYSDYSPENLKHIYDNAGLRVLS